MKTYLYILSFSLLATIRLTGQFLFNNLTKREGLSTSTVYCLYKDVEGFLWAGTQNGLNRYDGSSFKIFNKAHKNFPPIIDETVNAIAEDRSSLIYFGTKSGLYSYHKASGKMNPVPLYDEFQNIVSSPHIRCLFADSLQQLWIGTTKGLFLLKNKVAITASCYYPDLDIFNGRLCNALCVDLKRNAIWWATSHGLVMLDYLNGRSFSVDQNPKQWKLFDDNIIQSVAIDTSGNIWWSGVANPLSYFDFKTNTITQLKYFGNKSEWIIGTDGCNRLIVDNKNRLWISNYYYKIFVREPNGHFTMLPNQSPDPFKPKAGFFYDAIQDDEGIIWFATTNGISKLNPHNSISNIFEIKTNNLLEVADIVLINNCLAGVDGTWWIGKDDGLYHYDSHFNKLNEYPIYPDKSKKLQNRIFDLIWFDGEIWCGTSDFVRIFNPGTRQFRSLEFHPQIRFKKNNSVTWLYRDHKGFLWIPLWNDALCRYNPATKEIIKFDGSNSSHGDIGPTNSLCALEINDSTIWFNYGAQGIRVFNMNNQKFSPLPDKKTHENLKNCIIHNMIIDSRKNIWCSTPSRGILKLNSYGVMMDSITTYHGLKTSSVYNLARDAAGMIWITSPDGLQYFDPDFKQIFDFNIDLQLPSGDSWNVLKITRDTLITSNMDKLVFINLKNLHNPYANNLPLFTSISIFENEIPFQQSSSSPLLLKYSENFFTITYSSPHHSDITSLKYKYQLEGFDKDWVNAGRRQMASYTNVPDGSYLFKVKCITPDGLLTSEARLPVIIQSPFWKSWWFPAILMILMGTVAYRIASVRQKNQRKKEMDQAIDYFVHSVYGENTVHEICWDIARNCISKLQFEDCVVYLWDDSKNCFMQKAALGHKNPTEHEILNQIEIKSGEGIVGAAAIQRKPLLIGDTSHDTRYILDDKRRLSELAVPIIHDGKVIGVIDSEHSQKNFFTAEHVRTVSRIASISSNKLAEAQAEAYAKENEIKLLEINKLLAESQLMALRAQMNPHFVFNCLNSIQECIVMQNYGEASNYLNKFSKLFRTVLSNSGKNYVTLQEEKEVLELYLTLEYMRFDKSFSWQIILDDELEADEILIPSMLIQPYVENALWHGLMHKQGERKLKIEFNKLNDQIYQCTIDDNGIGRIRSYELKSQQSKSKRYESMGLRISKDRIDILNKQGHHARLEIQDKPDHQGTTVNIELSTFLKSNT